MISAGDIKNIYLFHGLADSELALIASVAREDTGRESTSINGVSAGKPFSWF